MVNFRGDRGFALVQGVGIICGLDAVSRELDFQKQLKQLASAR